MLGSAGSSSDNRAAARRDADALITAVRLPAGATRSGSEPRGDHGLLRHAFGIPAGVNLIDAHAFWTVSAPLVAVRAFVVGHRPLGARLSGTGSAGGPGIPANASMSFAFPADRTGIASRSVSISLVALSPHLTGVRADAQDVWLQLRAAAEHVPPGVRVLKVTRSYAQHGRGAQIGGAFTYTITRPRLIATIIRWLDALPIAQPGATSCPAQNASAQMRLTFLSSAGRRLAVATQTTGHTQPSTACNAMSFTVLGRAERPLLDGDHFLTQLNRLLQLPSPGRVWP